RRGPDRACQGRRGHAGRGPEGRHEDGVGHHAAVRRRRRRRARRLRLEDRVMSPEPLYILGAGMHPWGKWGNDFTEYGVAAARAALSEASLDWRPIPLVAGGGAHPTQRTPALAP